MKKREKPNKGTKSKNKENTNQNLVVDFDGEDTRKKIRALLKSYYGYTDDNNPFGDPELSKPFVWHKKIIKMRENGLEPFLDNQTLLIKIKEAKKEIDNIIKARAIREELKDAMEAEKNKNNEDNTKLDEWREKDEKFHLAQENLRTEIRIMQGREKPIDFINKVLMIWKGFAEPPKDFYEIPEYQRPYKLYEILDVELLKELYQELKIRLQIDTERSINKSFVCFYIDIASNFKKQHDISENDLKDFIEYWKAMIVIIESYIYPEKSIKNLPTDQLEQINSILEGKSLEELDQLDELMKSNLEEQISSVDIQFWKNALTTLQINRCKMILDNLYAEFKNSNEGKIIVAMDTDKENNMDVDTINTNIDNQNNIGNNSSSKKWLEEGNLTPPMYESDEDLRKAALCEHDYLIKLSETRKILLAHQLAKWQKNFEESNNLKTGMSNKNFLEFKVLAKNQFMENSELIINTQSNFKNMQKLKTSNDIITESKETINSDEEAEQFLSKIRKKDSKKGGTAPSISIAGTSLSTSKNQMDLLLGTGSYPTNTLKASRFYLKDEAMYDFNLAHEMMQIESQELGDGETIFNDVVPLVNSNYMWASKYKPRKPRYFNRVKTGYEWNKYNQVHYDYENPPPKVIQGYKFNIFYPDLIDKTKAPQYSLERSDTLDTCIIRFHAGPPYEDIAFKIVNREWDMTEKAGFKNLFDRGILYLYFNFKRYRYKR